MEDIGPIPGRYHRVRPDSLFKVSITEKFTKYLLKAGLQTLSVNKTDTPICGNSIKCKEFETLGINFIQKIEIAYFKRATTSPDVLSERPDFYLGRFLSMFSDFIFNFSIDLSTYDTNFLLEEEQLVWIIIKNLFNGLLIDGYFSFSSPKCLSIAEDLLTNSYSTFLDLITYSDVRNIVMDEARRHIFEAKYVNSSAFAKKLKLNAPLYLNDSIGSVPYCSIAPAFALTSNLLIQCDQMQPLLTPKGLCFSFNSLAMTELFKASTIVERWSTVLDFQQKSVLKNPSGFGQSHGLNFIINSFQTYSAGQPNKNFILSVTSPLNVLDVYKENYILTPGFHYEFKVLASQIVTIERFDYKKFTPRMLICL